MLHGQMNLTRLALPCPISACLPVGQGDCKSNFSRKTVEEMLGEEVIKDLTESEL